jgi:hypothetical protein
MYSRKQFFCVAARRCFDLINSCHSSLLSQEGTSARESTDLKCESLFFEAMRLGIDPGTLNIKQQIEAVNIVKEGMKKIGINKINAVMEVRAGKNTREKEGKIL